VQLSDEQLYGLAQGGDEVALRALLERYLPQLHAFVRLRASAELRARESSMDVVQSVCHELLAAAPRFSFRGEERFRAWLFTSALNKLREKHRRHRYAKRDVGRERPLPPDKAMVQAMSLLTPSVDAIGQETALALQESLAALSDEHREVITMARVLKLPHAVIAEATGRSEGAVRQLLLRALLNLAEELRKRGVAAD
jgi:RNA polymerase sigma-70 factor (ECF subfamily)